MKLNYKEELYINRNYFSQQVETSAIGALKPQL